jgi:hypothetical protein
LASTAPAHSIATLRHWARFVQDDAVNAGGRGTGRGTPDTSILDGVHRQGGRVAPVRTRVHMREKSQIGKEALHAFNNDYRSSSVRRIARAPSVSKARDLDYTFTDINVPGSQPYSTAEYGLGLNNLGQVVGSYSDNAENLGGFLYSGGKYVTVDAPGAEDTVFSGINDWGQIVGTASYSNGSSHNFIDTHGTFAVISDAVSLNFSDAINDTDQVLGSLGYPNFGVLNAHGVITPINLSGDTGSASFNGFNNFDQFTGTVCILECEGFIDTKGVFVQLGYPNA